MIGYIQGKLLHKYEDRVLLLANQVGYEILLPTVVREALQDKVDGDDVALYIYFQQTERQPKPLLIGFLNETEKEFFQLFISVADMGPLKAARALNQPLSTIARAIAEHDVARLQQLKGIGARTAQKIIAALDGKVGSFIESEPVITREPVTGRVSGLSQAARNDVLTVLTTQLGYKNMEARLLIQEALNNHPALNSAEELLDAIYRKP